MTKKHKVEAEIISVSPYSVDNDKVIDQLVNIRTKDGEIIKLYDSDSLASAKVIKKLMDIVIWIPWIDDNKITKLTSGTPQIEKLSLNPLGLSSSKMTIISKILNLNPKNKILIVDSGFGELYVHTNADLSALKVGDIIKFKTGRLDLAEILD